MCLGLTMLSMESILLLESVSMLISNLLLKEEKKAKKTKHLCGFSFFIVLVLLGSISNLC